MSALHKSSETSIPAQTLIKTSIYLFDWGDTLMVDTPGMQGKMCDWKQVSVVPFAGQTLKRLSARATIYIATAAGESSPEDIRKAFSRVQLDSYINGYFCLQNTGFTKPAPEFYQTILKTLGATPDIVTMVGDSLEKDILPCLRLGFNTIWLSDKPDADIPQGIQVISRLNQLV